ncbi:glycosyltransferase [Leptolyngbya boryana CZ1]|uniref:Glycosyltransferase n=1 Tax=Leptolyngbya boryana CZ1 TaxID=3060204 RepID=A0AA96WXC1_LEPBY|nr:glycosyltransferase [Leptolyngbya boryana]WNZ47626.1 glycosyltransferase [Leptolyngbya boryana CZ1]
MVLPLVSIVINNCNYASFLRDAIDSSLNQTYSNCELIVVDDGSTDNSKAIISEYGRRILPLFKQNGGQASALNAGFRQSQGEIVIFLDADDYLFPNAVEQVVRMWHEGLSKVHYRLDVLDAAGQKIGTHPSSRLKLIRGQAISALLNRGRYITSVTSGNAYSRTALEAVMPIPEAEFKIAADGYLNAVVPFYGTLEAIDHSLGAYRLHGGNLWAMPSSHDVNKLQAAIAHDFTRYRYLRSTAEAFGYSTPTDFTRYDATHLKQQLLLTLLKPGKQGFLLKTFALLVRTIVAILLDETGSVFSKLYRIAHLVRELLRAYFLTHLVNQES